MGGEDGSAHSIGKFDGTDYAFWRMQIEDYLYGKKLHQPLSKKPEKMDQDEWELLDRQVLGVIRLTLSKNVAHNVAKEKTTEGLMKVLSDMYEKPSANNKVFLMKKLFHLKMEEGGLVAAHVNEFNTIVNQLSSVEIEFDDEVRALILLASLPNSWEPMRAAVSNSVGTQKLKFNDVRDRILAEEVRRIDSGETSTNSAFNVENRGRKPDRNNRSNGRSKSRNGRGQSKFRQPAECWNCGKTGHIKRNCRAPPKKDDNKGGGANAVTREIADALVVSVDSPRKSEARDTATNTTKASISYVDSPVDSWVLDSGASFHTTPHQNIMENYVAGNYGKVYLADGLPLDIVGIGDINLKMSDGRVWKITKVRHVPKLMRNLISVGQLDDTGHDVNFGGGAWRVKKGSIVVARGHKRGTLYMTTSYQDTVAVVENAKQTKLWHCRLGHMSEKGMKLMVENGALPDLKTVDHQMCESCILGKQKRVSFSKGGREPKSEKLELVHTDVWGPAPVASLGGSYYYVTFIDDSTRKVWVYFMKNKHEVFSVFKRWKAMVENETNLKLKCLRSDNGGEYISEEFKRYCADNGIKMEKTIPGTPQQNGIAERMNRTLNERARSMRLHCGLPKTFWADAISTAAFLINRGPSVPLGFKIPEEVWSGKKANLSYLKIFGCLAYVHIDDAARSKLDSKSKKCYFIGYGNEEFGYRFWDDEKRKIIRSKNVVFNEEVLYKDKLREGSKTEEPGAVDLDDILTPELQQDTTTAEEEISQEESGEADESDDSEEVPYTPVTELRRSSRIIRKPVRFSPSLNYILLTDRGEPECYEEAMQVDESIKWELAMNDEMDSLLSNHTWELANLPKGKKALHNKWVYRIKEEPDGSKRYKARLVVKGFQQKEGVDYTEIFSPVVKMVTIRTVLGLVAQEDLHLQQMDVKTAFLHGDLDKEIYMKQPEGFEVKGKESLVCKLKRSLYGLKQAPRQWYKRFDSFIKGVGFLRCEADHCCYFKRLKESYLILLLYVDDMLIVGADLHEIDSLKTKLSEEFAMKDLGEARQILGMRISRSKEGLKLSQEEYVKKVLKRFNMDDAKPVNTPLANHFRLSKEQSPKTEDEMIYMDKVPYASAIGSLMYAMICTRPDIAHAVGVVSRFMSNPGKEHWEAVKWIFRYLRGNSSLSLCFTKSEKGLQGYVDANNGGDIDSTKSTTGYVYTFGGTAICWASKLQKIVSLSSCEAEYVAVTEATKEMMWLQSFLQELDHDQGKSVLYCDSKSAIDLAKNPVYHARTKHIHRRYHFIRSALEDEMLVLEKIPGSKNPADMLTKVVSCEKLRLCVTSVGLLE